MDDPAPSWPGAAMGRKKGTNVIAISYSQDVANRFGRRVRHNDSAHCNANNVGLWAICFRQHIAPLPGMAGACAQAIVYGRPWCTYKNVATCDRYPGGTNSPAYRCVKKVVPE